MREVKSLKLYIWAMAAHGLGLSGGDRIFIELSRRWSKIFPVDIFVWEEGYQMCERNNLTHSDVKFHVFLMTPWRYAGFLINYLARIIQAVITALFITLNNNPSVIVYSASDFWMDLFPAFILKLRYPKINWVAAWFQTAPNPLAGYTAGPRENKYNFSAFLYWSVQLISKPLIKKLADFVLVNNENERSQFPNLNSKRVIVLIGAVNLHEIDNWKWKYRKIVKKYDAVFQGRFHPQKGVVELIDIWKKVTDVKPDAKLALIGDGYLMQQVKDRIKAYGLENNVTIYGYVFDGDLKYRIFSESRIVVHPAYYDSGGMAAAEAMAFGLPAVGFNLPAYDSYYPEGMVKVEIGNMDKFAQSIIKLLSDNKYYKRVSKDALTVIKKNWDWNLRAEEILTKILSNVQV